MKKKALLAALVLATGACGGTGGKVGGVLLGAAAVTATVAFAGVGSPSGGKPVNKAEPNRDIDDPRHGGVHSCVAGNAEQNLAIVKAFEDSMHELVVCGGMTQRFSIGFIDALVNIAKGRKANPKGFKHLGGGRYQVGDVMVVSLHLPSATSFGAKGDTIDFDVFDLNSYFVGGRVVVRATSSGNADIAIDFTSRGPGAELLGAAVESGSRFKINFKALVKILGAIEVRQEIGVEDNRGPVSVVYDVVGAPVPIRNVVFAKSGGAPLNILGAKAHHTELGQTLQVTDWNMAFSGGSAKTLDGSVTFEIRGGDFDYRGTFTYPHRSTPDIELACISPATARR